MNHKRGAAVGVNGIGAVGQGDVRVGNGCFRLSIGCDGEVLHIAGVRAIGILQSVVLANGIKVTASGFEVGRFATGLLVNVNGVLAWGQIHQIQLDFDARAGFRDGGGADGSAFRVFQFHFLAGSTKGQGGGGCQDDQTLDNFHITQDIDYLLEKNRGQPATTKLMIQILLVEDNPIDARLVRHTFAALTDWPSEITWVDDGQKALQYLKCLEHGGNVQKPTVILLDLNLPKFDGLQVLEALRASATTISIPVFLFSSSPAEDVMEEAAARGLKADGYFEKPYCLQGFNDIATRMRDYCETATPELPALARAVEFSGYAR